MKKNMRKLFLLMAVVMTAMVCLAFSASAKTYCIEASPEVNAKAFEYLDEIYIEKHPEFGLEFPFGTEGDKKVLKAAADKITEGVKTDREKVERIIAWINDNIDYRSYTTGEGYLYAIDTYYNKKGNCVGLSQLILNFCRLSGIKAVMCCGARGDMESFITLEEKVPDHAWTMIYIDGKWCLYDPLFDVYGSSDKKFIDKWYFFDFIEGVSPYVEKYSEYTWTGESVFYIDGKFMYYAHGVPGSEYYQGNYTGGSSVNYCMPFYTQTYSEYDGCKYVENPERRNEMLTDECYTNGWLTYGTLLMYYMKPNGIQTGAKIVDHNDQCLYFSFMSGAVELPGKSEDYTLTDGYLTMYIGDTISFTPFGLEEELKSENVKEVIWKCDDTNVAKVDNNGVVTAVSEGFVGITATACYEEGGYNGLALFQIYVLPEKRTVEYSFCVDHKYDNACDATCNICNATRTVTHSYSPATCTQPKTCEVCKTTSGKALGHKYDNACDTTCNTCDAKRTITHSYSAATCTAPKTCEVCKATSGKALGHKEATLKAVAATCTKTGLTEGKKCSVCGEVTVAQKTVAKKAHSYKNVTTKATLKKNGKVESKCSVCGNVKSTTAVYYPKTIKLSKTAYTYNGKAQKPAVTVKDSKGNALKKGTDYTVTYEKKIKNPGTYNVIITFKGKYSGTKTLKYTIAPKATDKVTVVQSAKAIKLTWSKVTGATGYRVYQYDAKTKTWKNIKTLKTTSFKVQDLKSGTTYKFRIKAYTKDESTIWGKATTITAATKPTAPKITKLTTAKAKVSLTWSDAGSESGYEIYASTKKDSGFKKAAATKANKVKVTVSKLKSGRTYYFKVRAYKTAGETRVYSAWSAVKSVKIK